MAVMAVSSLLQHLILQCQQHQQTHPYDMQRWRS
jgi:hypothetical protein